MRRSKFVSADIVKKLQINNEESKDEKRRGSKGHVQGSLAPRQSILLNSFAPLKPIVQTRDSESQTDDSTPVKHFETSET